MATPQQLDVYKVVTDPSLDPDAKRAQIDMLYGVASPPAAGPDLRLAENTAPTFKPMGDDASLVAAAQAPDEASANDAIRRQLTPSEALSHPTAPVGVKPMEAVPTGAAPAAHAPAHAPGHAAASAEQGSPDDPETLGIKRLAAMVGGGGPRVNIPAHDQPVSTTLERAGGIPDDLKTAIGMEALHGSVRAVEAGEREAKTHLDAALAADARAATANQEREAFAANRQAQADHMKELDDGFEQLVKDTEVTPGSWWSSKTDGQKVISLIGAVMFGLAKDPEGLQKVIADDLALKREQRDKVLGGARHAIEDFKSQMMSPEAANAADQAIAARAVAAEATRMAEAAAAPEARERALEIAAKYQSDFNKWMADMAEKEAGASRTLIKHVPGQTVGGTMSQAEVANILIHKFKQDPAKVMRVLGGGKAPEGGGKEDAKTRVIFPDKTVGYTSEDLHKETQTELNSLGELQSDLIRIKALQGETGHTIAGTDKARLDALTASALGKLQAMQKSEGANGRMAGEMLERLEVLAGSKAKETLTTDESARASIDESLRIFDNQIQGIKNRLTPKADTVPSGGKIETLGATADELGATISE